MMISRVLFAWIVACAPLLASPHPTATLPIISPSSTSLPSLGQHIAVPALVTPESAAAVLSPGNIAYNAWKRPIVKDPYKVGDDLRISMDYILSSRQEVIAQLSDPALDSFHRLVRLSEIRVFDYDEEMMLSASKAVSFYRLNIDLKNYDLANAVTPMDPSIRIYILKSIAEIRTFVSLSLNRLSRLGADISAQEVEIKRLARIMCFVSPVERRPRAEEQRALANELLALNAIKLAANEVILLQQCAGIHIDLKDACLLKAHTEYEALQVGYDSATITHTLSYWLEDSFALIGRTRIVNPRKGKPGEMKVKVSMH